ncbi:MAG: DUF3892 domain-containing protein [Massilia sp.]
MAHLQITAVTLQGEPRVEHIAYVHGAFGVKAREQAVAEIWLGTNTFFTVGPFAFQETEVEAVGPLNMLASMTLLGGGQGYLRTRPNGTTSDNLLSLPRVPAPPNSLLAMALAGGMQRHMSR